MKLRQIRHCLSTKVGEHRRTGDGYYVTEQNWRWGNMWQRRTGDALCDRGELEMGQYVTEENWRWGNM